jgi:hypothetical protein
MKLFQREKSNTKTAKNGVFTLSLSLAQADLSGTEVCPYRTNGCTAVCVGKAGLAGVFPKIMERRIAKTRYFFDHREKFMSQLIRELNNAEKYCERHDTRGLVRLNTFSDIGWWALLGDTIAYYKNLNFYDYTKSMKAALWGLNYKNTNYRLCYSLNEKSNWNEVKAFLDKGGTVAVVFRDVVYNPAHGKIGELPATWRGYKVVDGDITDNRFADPEGCIVGLRLKGTKVRKQAACDTGFAVYAFGQLTSLTVSK